MQSALAEPPQGAVFYRNLPQTGRNFISSPLPQVRSNRTPSRSRLGGRTERPVVINKKLETFPVSWNDNMSIPNISCKLSIYMVWKAKMRKIHFPETDVKLRNALKECITNGRKLVQAFIGKYEETSSIKYLLQSENSQYHLKTQ
jgi:hypothetical protein